MVPQVSGTGQFGHLQYLNEMKLWGLFSLAKTNAQSSERTTYEENVKNKVG